MCGILYTVYCILYTVYCILYTVLCAVCSMQYAVYCDIQHTILQGDRKKNKEYRVKNEEYLGLVSDSILGVGQSDVSDKSRSRTPGLKNTVCCKE